MRGPKILPANSADVVYLELLLDEEMNHENYDLLLPRPPALLFLATHVPYAPPPTGTKSSGLPVVLVWVPLSGGPAEFAPGLCVVPRPRYYLEKRPGPTNGPPCVELEADKALRTDDALLLKPSPANSVERLLAAMEFRSLSKSACSLNVAGPCPSPGNRPARPSSQYNPLRCSHLKRYNRIWKSVMQECMIMI